jgi:putative ABC transport system permease protein
MSPERRPSFAERIFRALVRLFPFDFRADHGCDLEQTLREQHRDAQREGGGASVARLWLDVARDVLMTAPREHLVILKQDVGYALRALRRAPVFAISAVLTLAIGMSAIMGMAAVLNAVMFRPLPVDHPEQLISISNQDGLNQYVSYPDLLDYRAETSVISDAIGYVPRVATLNIDGSSERITLELVTDNYFSMLGVQPAAGRLIQPDEGRAPGEAPVIVLSYAYWQSRFNGDRSIVGRTVRLGSQPFTVIGISSETFRSTESLLRVSAYVPAWMIDSFMSWGPQPKPFENRSLRTFNMLGRLKPGVSLAQARSALSTRAAQLARDYPEVHKDISLLVIPETHARPTPGLGSILRLATTAIAGLAAVLVLITSANVANLLMARASSRSREVALRSALGARRGRLARQFLTESITLALLGALVSIPVVIFATTMLRRFVSNVTAVIAFDVDFTLDILVLATMLMMAIGAGVVAGLAPALAVCRADLGARLKSGARDTSDRSGGRMRSALVVAQVALSLTLLVSGGLFVRSLDRARRIDLGFEPEGLLLATTAPTLQGYDFQRRLTFYTAARDRIAAVAGVEQVAWIQFPPLGIIGEAAVVAPEPRPSDPGWRPPLAAEADISPEYFETARMRLVEGRPFDQRDREGSPPVVIINETLAHQFWPGDTPLGRTLMADGDRVEVVGVVQNGKYQNVGEPPRNAIFRPLAQTSPVTATAAIRTSGSPPELARAVRQAIAQTDPEVAVYDVRSMLEHLDNGSAFFPFRLAAFMTTLFGGMGVLLAAIGLYGMIAYHVGQRTLEIGVRMALGARAADIIRDVLAQGGRFAVIGIAIGILLAVGLAQLLKGLLLGVSPFDPITYAVVAGVLAAICLTASFVPARRATRVDPLIALRAE